MTHIAFLIGETDRTVDGNYLRFANALLERGDTVALVFMESLGMAASRVVANGIRLDGPLAVDTAFPAQVTVDLAEFDVVWVLSLGMRHSFLDKLQLLFTLQGQCRIINSIDAIMHFKSKYFTTSHPDAWQHPATWASNRPADLYRVMQREGGQWIVKPPASSFGRDVFLLTAEDPNARVILASMCGPEEDRYCLLQRYIPEIRKGEKRVLLAGGKPVGQYLRQAIHDHRTNAFQGAEVQACELTPEENALAERIGSRLMSFGAEFVGMDLVYPWVIEFNVINPGGLLTINDLTRVDLTPEILKHILVA